MHRSALLKADSEMILLRCTTLVLSWEHSHSMAHGQFRMKSTLICCREDSKACLHFGKSGSISYLTQAPSDRILRHCGSTAHSIRFLFTGRIHCDSPFANKQCTEYAEVWFKLSIQWEYFVYHNFAIKLGIMGTTVFHSGGDNGVAGNGGVCLNSTRMRYQPVVIDM